MMTFVIVVTFFAVLILIFWVWLSIVLSSVKNKISPMPTSEKVKRKVLTSIPPKIHGTLIDLGSGWGNVAIALARQFPQCQIIGYETSPVPYYFSKMWHYFYKTSNLKLVKKDFFSISLRECSLIYTYLCPEVMNSLKEKFDKELAPGTIVISNTFAIPGWIPIQILQEKDLYNTRIYIYVKNSSNVDALCASNTPPV